MEGMRASTSGGTDTMYLFHKRSRRGVSTIRIGHDI
jgi:hypothetical protein